MIRPDKNNGDGQPEIEPQDMFKSFFVLLVSVGGSFSFPAKLLDEISDDEELMNVTYNEADDRIYVVAKKKRHRGIIKPKRKLILPN